VTGTARAPVAGDLVFNEVLADPPGASTDLAGDANKDGVHDGTQDEFIEFVNTTSDTLILDGVKVYRHTVSAGCPTACYTDPATPGTDTKFTFPNGTNLAPGKAVVVFGGVQTGHTLDAASFGGSLVFAAAAPGASGKLTLGDTSYLSIAAGAVVLDKFAYTTDAAKHPQATLLDANGSDQSVNRSPDRTGTTWAKFTTITGHVGKFSAGTKLDGTNF
jgi:hypothetical protein